MYREELYFVKAREYLFRQRNTVNHRLAKGRTMQQTARPRRSVLYMPGSNARALDKAKTLPADGLILDLEDAVAPDAK